MEVIPTIRTKSKYKKDQTNGENYSFSLNSGSLDKMDKRNGLERLKIYNEDTEMFTDYDERYQTFIGGLRTYHPKAITMSQAGFYLVQRNKVQCFRCKGILEYWLDDEDPWEQHAFWYGECPFILEEKGLKFVEDTIAKLSKKYVEKSLNNIMRDFVNNRMPKFSNRLFELFIKNLTDKEKKRE